MYFANTPGVESRTGYSMVALKHVKIFELLIY
jgi:hypothetical protein